MRIVYLFVRAIAERPRRGLIAGLVVACAAAVGFGFVWRQYRSYPTVPERLTFAAARARADAGPEPWIETLALTPRCDLDFKADRYAFAPVVQWGEPLLLLQHRQVQPCAELRGRSAVGVLERAQPRYIATLRAQFGPLPSEVWILNTQGGPANARIGLYLLAFFVVLGLGFYPLSLALHRDWKVGKLRL